MKVTFLFFLTLCFLTLNTVFCMDHAEMTESDIENLTQYMGAGMSFEDAIQAVIQDKSSRATYAAANIDERDASLGDAEIARVMQLMEETGMSFEDAVRATRNDRSSSSTLVFDQEEVKEMDPATTALIARLEAENHPQPIQYQAHSIFHTARNHKDVAAHRATLAPLVTYISTIPQGADVHIMDAHVTANIAKLPIIGDAFGIDTPNLSIADIQTYLNQFTTFYTGYEGQAVSSPEIQGYIAAALSTASGDKTTIGIYSRIVSIFKHLENEIDAEDFHAHLKHLFDAIAENYKTRGGCFQGVRNRAYIRYISTLNILMGQ